MTCAGAIFSTLLEICFVTQPPELPTGFAVGPFALGDPAPRCVVVSSKTCEEVAGCNLLGGVEDGCARGTNFLFDLVAQPGPGEVFFVSFEEQL